MDAGAGDAPSTSRPADRRATVRFRVVLSMALVLAVVLAAAGVTAVYAVRTSLTNQLDEQLEAANRIAPLAVPMGDATSVPGVDRAGPGDPPVVELVFGSDGRLRRFAQQPDLLPVLPVIPSNEAAALTGQIYTAPAEDGRSSFRVLITPGIDGGGRVLAISLSDVDRTVGAVERTMIITGVVAFVLGFALVWWVLRRGLRPMARLADEAERVVEGDGASRIDLPDDRSEVARVGAAMDLALDRLDATRAGEQRATAAARSADRRLRAFIEGAALELRAPAASMERAATLLQAGTSEAEDLRQTADEVESAAHDLAIAVDELGWLAQLERGTTVMQQAVDIAALVREVVHDAAIERPERSMTVAGADAARTILGDRPSLRHAIAEVVASANGQAPTALPVEVRMDADDEVIEVVVADHGPDLAPEEAASILRPFHSSRAATSGGGRRSLFVPAAIVEAHEGMLAFSPTPGGGATFTITLPTLAVTAARQHAAHDDR